ncbi:MAG: hypothetical protein JWM19_7917 [Actinomycetia bacterium]|nr:hypothetical protein [Actinomycetes bacterium]
MDGSWAAAGVHCTVGGVGIELGGRTGAEGAGRAVATVRVGVARGRTEVAVLAGFTDAGGADEHPARPAAAVAAIAAVTTQRAWLQWPSTVTTET